MGQSLQKEGVKLDVWDLGDDGPMIGSNYYEGTDALIYVVDSTIRSDTRMRECVAEFQGLLAHEKLAGVPTLIFANKQDQLAARPADEIADMWSLGDIRDRMVNIQACTGKSGEGLSEGFEWIAEACRAGSS